jgi:hypothetical protein
MVLCRSEEISVSALLCELGANYGTSFYHSVIDFSEPSRLLTKKVFGVLASVHPVPNPESRWPAGRRAGCATSMVSIFDLSQSTKNTHSSQLCSIAIDSIPIPTIVRLKVGPLGASCFLVCLFFAMGLVVYGFVGHRYNIMYGTCIHHNFLEKE